MFAYIKGTVEEKGNNYVVIDSHDIGYKIFMSNIAINEIGELGSKVKVHTYYYVREDNISLYGFVTKEELKMFELLLSVSGIGAKSAISMLSNITPSSFALAVISNDVAKLKKIPGVGPKSAQRIILELQDKLKAEQKEFAAENPQIEIEKVSEDENVKEAKDALQILGYTKREIDKAFEKIISDGATVEELIKKGLTILSMQQF